MKFFISTKKNMGIGIGPNPQSPIPNPQSPIPNNLKYNNYYYTNYFSEKKYLFKYNL